MRVFYCLLLSLLISCSDSDKPIDGTCVPIVIDQSIFNDSDFLPANLIEYSLDENCLMVTLSVGGCDGNHDIDMVTDGAIAESDPPQITFDFRDNTPQSCYALFQLERSFDLTKISELIEGDIVVRFRENEDLFFLYPN